MSGGPVTCHFDVVGRDREGWGRGGGGIKETLMCSYLVIPEIPIFFFFFFSGKIYVEGGNANPCHQGTAADAPTGAYTCPPVSTLTTVSRENLKFKFVQ